ncbi:hypothetical protein BOO22_13910 [Vibrio cidicii]|nr:hypothetical protein [Vibrio cidicii]
MKNSTIFTFPIRHIDPHFQQNDKTPSLSSEDRKTNLTSNYKAADLRALPLLNKDRTQVERLQPKPLNTTLNNNLDTKITERCESTLKRLLGDFSRFD